MTEEISFQLQAERAVLGSAMSSKDSLDTAFHIIGADPERFTDPANRLVYSAILQVNVEVESVDITRVQDELKKRGELEEAGGDSYLRKLSETSDHTHVERDARTVVFPRRAAPESAEWIIDVLPDYLDRLEDPRMVPHRTVPTGFRDLDSFMTGLEPGTLTVISGRPSVGKSTLLGTIARSAAITSAVPTAWIDQDSPRQQLIDRIMAAEARVPLTAIRTRQLNDDAWTRIARRMGEISLAPLLLHAGARIDVAQVQKIVQETEIELLTIDGLQQMKPSHPRETREREVSDITRGLKTLALEFDIPVVATAHLNRAPLQRFDPSPTLDDLRESDLIAHLADNVILLERPDLNDKESPRAGEIDLVLAKHRDGPTFTVTAAFQGHYARCVDMAPPQGSSG